jgi:hypothetical protein
LFFGIVFLSLVFFFFFFGGPLRQKKHLLTFVAFFLPPTAPRWAFRSKESSKTPHTQTVHCTQIEQVHVEITEKKSSFALYQKIHLGKFWGVFLNQEFKTSIQICFSPDSRFAPVLETKKSRGSESFQ